MRLSGKTVTVGVTGGIAAYKTCELVSRLKKEGAQVFVAMTENAARFVAPLTFDTLSGNRTVTDTFDRSFAFEVEHISLAKKTDLLVVAPATANFLAKYALGLADDFLSTTALAMTCPVLLAPAMNTAMFNHPATRQNLQTLCGRGVSMITGGSGRLACGDEGEGRMAEPQEILEKIVALLTPKADYAGKRVLITAGGTGEPIDPVRFITNRSSGKMGIALAAAAAERGAEVVLVYGNISVPLPLNVKTVHAETTSQMLESVKANLDWADVVIKAAAPSDYRVDNYKDNKLKGDSLTLSLTKNPDIAKYVGENKGGKKLVIFCAETQELIENAKKKLKAKNADMVVANDVTKAGAGFHVDTNIVTILTKKKSLEPGQRLKTELADIILDEILEL